MIFGRLFRRGRTAAPPSLAEGLLAPLGAAGLEAVVVEGGVVEGATRGDPALGAPGAPRGAGLRPEVVSRGLVQVRNGPPDFVQVTSEGTSGGHLVRSAAIGFHFLVQREGLEEAWPRGKVVARREFGGVGAARGFHWEAAMGESDVAEPEAVRAAEQMNGRTLPRDEILALLQEPNTLVLEVAPDVERGMIRASVFFGGRESIGVGEVELMRDLCRAIAGVG